MKVNCVAYQRGNPTVPQALNAVEAGKEDLILTFTFY